MKRSIINIINIFRNEKGSFTIEASLVFPVIFLCTISILFFSLFMYSKAVIYQAAALTADRAAYNWDNSHKDLTTGSFSIQDNDELYWRVLNDSISDMFGFIVANQTSKINLTDAAAHSYTNGPKFKLQQAAQMLPTKITGNLSYTNRLVDRRVKVELDKTFLIPSFLEKWLPINHVSVMAESVVTEPVEFIRTIDLTRTYAKKIKGFISAKEAKQTLQDLTPVQPAVVINTEAEASDYIRNLVNGHKAKMATDVGELRIIDALDNDGIAHEAKYTVNLSEARQEIRKDVELMKKGEIKGAVWHFFRVNKNGTIGLTDSLRKDLEKNGIVIVIHN